MREKKFFFFIFLFALGLFFAYFSSLPDGRLHLVFCEVGQGDGIYLRTPKGEDVVIDGGPEKKILTCLGRHLPFYDRTIELVILSHPQKDHYGGLIFLAQRYTIKNFVQGPITSQNQDYQAFLSLLSEKKVPQKILYAGDKFSLDGVDFTVYWPEKNWVAENTFSEEKVGKAGSSAVLGLQTSRDLNDFSFYLHLSFGSFDALFTGDGDSRIQPEILRRVDLPEVEVLKLPHHGSKYAVTKDFLEKVRPKLAVISVGKNPWGHPTFETLSLLEKAKILVKRTDQEGEIEIFSDGASWWLKP